LHKKETTKTTSMHPQSTTKKQLISLNSNEEDTQPIGEIFKSAKKPRANGQTPLSQPSSEPSHSRNDNPNGPDVPSGGQKQFSIYMKLEKDDDKVTKYVL